jgi:hypothetical protein
MVDKTLELKFVWDIQSNRYIGIKCKLNFAATEVSQWIKFCVGGLGKYQISIRNNPSPFLCFSQEDHPVFLQADRIGKAGHVTSGWRELQSLPWGTSREPSENHSWSFSLGFLQCLDFFAGVYRRAWHPFPGIHCCYHWDSGFFDSKFSPRSLVPHMCMEAYLGVHVE